MSKRQTVKFGRARLARYSSRTVVTGESPRFGVRTRAMHKIALDTE